MKYIKTYENVANKCYWLLPTDERFEDALKKIECDPDYIKIYLDSDGEVRKHNYVFVRKDINKAPHVWGWNPFEGDIRDGYFDSKKLEFKGLVMLTDDEIEKIEISKDIRKYNL